MDTHGDGWSRRSSDSSPAGVSLVCDLCCEDSVFQHGMCSAGKAIIDNITDAIYGSRKTICVISRRYLESEWCSREIQVAR